MRKHIPNMITCCNLICGCIAAGAGFHNNFATAFLFILMGAVFDFFDGMVARKLGVSGPMGVELDSLADVVTFGVAPASMVFTMATQICYPSFMYSKFFFVLVPYTAFLIPAFSALRLAKFNLDDRQHETFIGMPTPANALFWSALIFSSIDYLKSPMFNALWLVLFIIMFCWLLVSEVPMFSLKFRNLGWEGNKVRWIYIIMVAVIMLLFAVSADGHIWKMLARGLACSVGLYVVICLVQLKCSRS